MLKPRLSMLVLAALTAAAFAPSSPVLAKPGSNPPAQPPSQPDSDERQPVAQPQPRLMAAPPDADGPGGPNGFVPVLTERQKQCRVRFQCTMDPRLGCQPCRSQ
jgi:hypothetical protein